MAVVLIEHAFQSALAHHQAGRLAEAEALYRQILTAQPDHANALHMLGVIAHQVDRNEVAVELIHKAIAIVPAAPAFHSNLGETYRKLGHLDEAIAAFRRAIHIKPDYAKAHNNLGVALMEQGLLAEAGAALRRAIEIEPDYAEAHKNLGVALRGKGYLEEAIAACRRAIQLKPDYADVHNVLGLALTEQGLPAEAGAALHRAIELKPHYAEAHCNLGIALRDQGCLDEAVAAYRRAIQLKPDLPEIHNNLGVALTELGLPAEGGAALRQAINLNPDYTAAYCNLGNALRKLGRLDEAIATYQRAIELKPGYAEAHSYLGNVLGEQGRLGEAVAHCLRAIELKPDYANAHNNLGVTLMKQGLVAEAEAALLQAIELKPDGSPIKFNYSLLLLLRGEFEHGWPLYETRWEMEDYKPLKRNFSQPIWKGEPLHDRRILIHAEQGLGDTLQLVRYAALVAQRGGQVIVECQPEVKTLLENSEGISEIIARGEPLPGFELHCPMMTLPLAFGTRVETIPSALSYLRADASRAIRWRERLDRERGPQDERGLSRRRALKVGLVWAGGTRPHQPDGARMDWRRSMLLSQFAPMAGVPGVVFISLQKGGPAAQAQTPPAGMTLLDWTGELHDFADTAALVECLDLVISVDTAVAHLAGALGKPVWLLNRFDTCWRWLLEREDSPWYPTMRLFRQPKFGDWPSVIQRIAEELTSLVSKVGC